MSNIIKATFADGERRATTEALYQWDYGQALEIDGLELPHNFEVHFGNSGSTTTVTQIATDGVVTIPDAVLTVGKSVDVFIYLHTGQSDGETEYRIVIPVRARQQPTHETPTPVQQSEIEEAIAALESAAYNPVESGTGRFSVRQKAGTGDENAVSGNNAAGFGLLNTVSGAGAVAFGSYNEATGACAFASGSRVSGQSGQVASGAASTVIGGSNNATANYATAIGRQNTASAQGATAIGMRGTASGSGSAVVGGLDNVASGTYATTVGGSGNTASANYALAAGYKTIANGRASAVFGQCNVEDDSPVNSEHGAGARNLLFIVGNGKDADHRSNAMMLDWDGNATLAGKMTLGADPTTEMDAATKKYVLEAVQSGGGLTRPAASLLMTILEEAVYGSNQTSNLDLLREILLNVDPVSISATFTGEPPLIGTAYSDLAFEVTCTYSDGSTDAITDFEVSSGNVTSGSNTVTISYMDLTTTCTFEASETTAFEITYNLSHVSSSSAAVSVAANGYYDTVLSVEEDYSLNSVTVTMGGEDVTASVYNNMEIMIQAVTGDIVITANATAVVYLDPLLVNAAPWTYIGLYSDAHQTSIRTLNTSFGTASTEYPALYDCELHWEIKNISESQLSYDKFGFGSINVEACDFRPGNNQIDLSYVVEASTQSGKLDAGSSIEGTVTLKAGYQLMFYCKHDQYSSFELKISGSYVPNTFSGYTEILANTPLATYGSYRTVTWYSDNGTTQINTGGLAPYKLTDTLEAGTYNVYFCVATTMAPTNDTIRNNFVMGGMSSTTDTTVNYAFGLPQNYPYPNIWYHSQMTISSGQTVACRENNLSYMDGTNASAILKIKKVVGS